MATLEEFSYDDEVVKQFLWATIIWGAVGLLVGVVIAIQMFAPAFNFNTSWLTFGRLRPLHTNAVIFAFCGNAIFAGVYHSSQRLLKTRMWSDTLSKVHMWGWQAIILAAAITLPLGLTSSKEYAELEWPIDIAIAAVWVVFAVNYFMTLRQRRESILYVSIWFYIATIIAITMLHVVNSFALPVGLWKSYSAYSGVQDALVQWWYGHNAVAFFLTTPFLGLAYYYVPKAVGKPIFSYRLSIIHFWSLIFIYIWAGPHHLQFTALPEWIQSLGMVFSVMLIAPSWGGAINFLLTINADREKLKADPVVKFLLAATVMYMIATFEGPMLSIKSINAITHYTDWTIAHVHGGALGWNGFTIFGLIYFVVPALFGTELYSRKLAHWHFWLGFVGMLAYVLAIWTSGALQGTMSLAMSEAGVLKNPVFTEIMNTVKPMLVIRSIGGTLYLTGLLLMAYNVYKTIAGRRLSVMRVSHPALVQPTLSRTESLHARAERLPALMTILATIALAIGGMVEMIPMFTMEQKNARIDSVKPYTPLELEGRDIYIREGCNNCHTQAVRVLVPETQRYGPASRAGEYVYEFPHLWGSKRTGPDLHRVGGKYNELWHWKHMQNPRELVADSVMPNYPWLAIRNLDSTQTEQKLSTMKMLGVPYSNDNVQSAQENLRAQQLVIKNKLMSQGLTEVNENAELIALIAYLQRLGQDIKGRSAVGGVQP